MISRKGKALRRVIYSVTIVGAVGFCLSCRSPSNQSTNTVARDVLPQAVPPFRTREPARYRAVRTVTSTWKGSDQKTVSRTLIARDGPMRREEYENSAGQTIVYLETPAGRYVLVPEAKLVAQVTDTFTTESDRDLSTAEISADLLLNETPDETRYELVGSEAVAGRDATKYRVLTHSPAGDAPDTQSLIWIDNTLQMPVRWETTTDSGDESLSTIMELSEITLEVSPGAFQVPPNYQRVDISALAAPLKANRGK